MAQNTKKYTPAQKQKYFNAQAKKGSTRKVKDKETGKTKIVKNSDFVRGVNKAKADAIAKARTRTWRKHHGGKQTSLNV